MPRSISCDSALKGDTEGDMKETPDTVKKGVSLSLRIVEALRSEPDRALVVRDLVDRTGGIPDTVKRELARLSSTGKGSGPVRRVEHGLYQYAPEKERQDLRALMRSGNWKIENLVFVSLGAQGGAVSPVREPETLTKGTLSDPTQPTSRSGYPWTLPTGQIVTWGHYENGTETIRFSAKGSPPFSPDSVLILIDQLRKDGLNTSTWNCTSLELNIDSRQIRFDASYSFQLIEGVILKAYQHGYNNARIEIADRRTAPAREIMELFRAIAAGVEGKETAKRVNALEKQIQKIGETSKLALSLARKAQNNPAKPSSSNIRKKGKTCENGSTPVFTTGADEILRDSAKVSGLNSPGPAGPPQVQACGTSQTSMKSIPQHGGRQPI
jgi:hypothetical protein